MIRLMACAFGLPMLSLFRPRDLDGAAEQAVTLERDRRPPLWRKDMVRRHD